MNHEKNPAYVHADILSPGPARSRRRRPIFAWCALVVLVLGLVLAIFGGVL
jgi:hypothetical protein